MFSVLKIITWSEKTESNSLI